MTVHDDLADLATDDLDRIVREGLDMGSCHEDCSHSLALSALVTRLQWAESRLEQADKLAEAVRKVVNETSMIYLPGWRRTGRAGSLSRGVGR